MPKLNPTHLPERLKEAIKELEAGIEVEAKKMGITKLLLNVRSDNEKAIWFYIKCGFTLVKEIENFYATGDLKYNAQVFQKEIEGQQSI